LIVSLPVELQSLWSRRSHELARPNLKSEKATRLVAEIPACERDLALKKEGKWSASRRIEERKFQVATGLKVKKENSNTIDSSLTGIAKHQKPTSGYGYRQRASAK